MEKQLNRIREKLKILRNLDTGLEVFGAEKHQYKLRKKLTAPQIAAFEAKNQVQLPLEYVAFLTRLGNGGAGPFYGIETLHKSLYQDLDSPSKKSVNIPAKSFPHVTDWNPVEEMVALDKQLRAINDGTREDPVKALWAQRAALVSGEEHNYGVLSVCNYGYGLTILLVVNGAEKGNLWTDYRAYDEGICPNRGKSFDDSTRISFLDWYEKWLDKATEAIHAGLNRYDSRADWAEALELG
jgi:hypothetical protein